MLRVKKRSFEFEIFGDRNNYQKNHFYNTVCSLEEKCSPHGVNNFSSINRIIKMSILGIRELFFDSSSVGRVIIVRSSCLVYYFNRDHFPGSNLLFPRSDFFVHLASSGGGGLLSNLLRPKSDFLWIWHPPLLLTIGNGISIVEKKRL